MKYALFSETDGKRIADVVRRYGPRRGRSVQPRARRRLPRSASPILLLKLTKVAGTDGNATTAASWMYRVDDVITGEEYYPLVELTSGIHTCQRPLIGQRTPAKTGIGYVNENGDVVVHSFDEFDTLGVC